MACFILQPTATTRPHINGFSYSFFWASKPAVCQPLNSKLSKHVLLELSHARLARYCFSCTTPSLTAQRGRPTEPLMPSDAVGVSISPSLSVCLSLPRFLSLSVYLSLFLYLSASLSIYPSIYLSISLSLYLPVYPAVYLSICLSLSLSLYLSTSLHLSIHPSIHPSIYPSIYLSPSLRKTPPIGGVGGTRALAHSINHRLTID